MKNIYIVLVSLLMSFPLTAQVLPVTLTSYTAVKVDKKIKLQWTSETEVNASHYRLQKSYDGINFTHLNSINASGHGDTYTYYDEISPLTVYYRLVQVDRDDKQTVFSVLSITRDNKSLIAYPNPVTNILYFESGVEIRIVDITGKEIYKGNGKSFDISKYSTGTYFVSDAYTTIQIIKN